MTAVAKDAQIAVRGPVLIKGFKDIDTTGKRIAGYYTAFNNVDAHGDRARKGMTLKSIAETGPSSTKPRIKHFLNHDMRYPLTPLIEMGEDDFGAWYVGKIVDESIQHNEVENFLKMALAGIITEHSYMLRPVRQQYDEKTGINELIEVKVYEVSSLTFMGANEMTPLTELSKSMSPAELIKYWTDKEKAIEAFCRNSTATDDCIESLLIYQKELTQHIITLSTTTQAEDNTKASAGGTGEDYSGLLSILKETNTIYKNI